MNTIRILKQKYGYSALLARDYLLAILLKIKIMR